MISLYTIAFYRRNRSQGEIAHRTDVRSIPNITASGSKRGIANSDATESNCASPIGPSVDVGGGWGGDGN